MYYLLLLLIIFGIAAVLSRQYGRKQQSENHNTPACGAKHGECCGRHEICEHASLLADARQQIDYYDDEELDRFKNRSENDYDENDEVEFREILLTMHPKDIPGWLNSLSLRNINPPTTIRLQAIRMQPQHEQTA